MKAGWRAVLLGDVMTLKRGYDLPTKRRVPGEIPVFSSSGINGTHSKPMCAPPGVITGRYGTIGQVFFSGVPYWPLNTALYVEDFKGSVPRFVYYYLKTVPWERFSNKSAVPGVNRNEVHKLELEWPPVKVQQRIADILTPLDEKIEVNGRIIENLERQAQAMFQERFIDNARSDWTVGTVSDLGTVVGGGTPSKARPDYYTERGIAWITPKDLSMDRLKFILRGKTDLTELGLQSSGAKLVPAGTVLFSSRAPIGYVAIAAGEVSTNQGFKSVVPHQHIGTPYVYYFLKNNLSIIESMSTGTTFKEVSGSVMKSVPALLPDADSLSEFSSFCNPLFRKQRQMEKENRRLSKLRDMLLPKLLSGEIDVSDIQQ